MKVPKSLIAGVGILMVGITPLLQAAPGQGPDDQGGGRGEQHQQGGPGQGGQGGQNGQGDHRGNDNRGGGMQGGRPPQDFGQVRQNIHDNRQFIGQGGPRPQNIQLERGRPLPHGYGRRLDARALQHMPRYDGYEWRRVGPDMVLVAVGTGLVYEILDNVLN